MVPGRTGASTNAASENEHCLHWHPHYHTERPHYQTTVSGRTNTRKKHGEPTAFSSAAAFFAAYRIFDSSRDRPDGGKVTPRNC